MRVVIQTAPAELFDRITILQIKEKYVNDKDKLSHILTELRVLKSASDEVYQSISMSNNSELDELVKKLYETNERIWHILQEQRDIERASENGWSEQIKDDFIKISLAVYHVNDERAEYKRKINKLTNTDIAEVKSYK